MPVFGRDASAGQANRQRVLELLQTERRKGRTTPEPDELRHAGRWLQSLILPELSACRRRATLALCQHAAASMSRYEHGTPIFRTEEIRRIEALAAARVGAP